MGLTTIWHFCFMTKEEIYGDVINAVAEVTGIEIADIRTSRSEVCTDARYILVRYLFKLLPCVTIATLLGRTRQGIYSILQRSKGDTWLTESNWKAVVKKLESKYFIHQ